jgi:hypothetical protein
MSQPDSKVEYAARTPFHEERSRNIIPASIAAEVEHLNTETRSDEPTPVTRRVLHYDVGKRL